MPRQTARTTVTRKPTLMSATEEVTALAPRLAGLGLNPLALAPVMQVIREKFEAMPVHRDGITNGWTLYFVLAGGEWWPACAGEEITDGPYAGWLRYRINYTDGSAESGVIRPYRWAHCCADNSVNYHWFEALDNEPGLMAWAARLGRKDEPDDDEEEEDDHFETGDPVGGARS